MCFSKRVVWIGFSDVKINVTFKGAEANTINTKEALKKKTKKSMQGMPHAYGWEILK